MKEMNINNFSQKQNRSGYRAQAMVEFAIVMPVLLVLLFGIIELGRVMFIYTAMTNASREASRFASAVGFNDNTYYKKYQYCSAIRNAAKNSAFLMNLQDSNIVIEYDHGPSTAVFDTCPSGVANDPTIVVKNGQDRVKVTVSASYLPLVQLIPISERTITSSSARTILGFTQVGPSYP
jgi:Flp pilus assembly protein TadG